MESWHLLQDIVVLLSAALVLGIVFERVGQSAIVGCMVAGTLVGPGFFRLVTEEASIQGISEIGVALLLFTIGLENSWRRFRSLGSVAIGGGILQIIVTMGLVFAATLVAGFPANEAIILGAVVAMSSTATVIRSLEERSETDSEHGRAATGILILQDAAVVPLVLLTEFMGEGGSVEGIAREAGIAAFKGALLVFILIAVGGFIMPRLVAAAALAKNRDLPVILAVTACLAAAWAAHDLGLSPALGAFAAGMILADSPLAVQMRADVAAIRIIFVSIFFAAIGMLADLEWMLVPMNLARTALLVAAILVGKALIIWLIVRLLRSSSRVGLAAGVCLAQIGEFSFVLAASGRENGVIDDDRFQLIITASLVTLMLTPTLVKHARGITRLVTRDAPTVPTRADAARAERLVIVIGYGPAGREVIQSLKENGFHPRLIDHNPRTVGHARAAGIDAITADAASQEVLHHCGIDHALGVAIAIPDVRAASMIVTLCRRLHSDIPVVVRCRYSIHVHELETAGAHVVVDEEDTVGRLLGWKVVRAATDRLPTPPEAQVIIQEEAMP